MGRGNESLFAGSGSHDQDGHHAVVRPLSVTIFKDLFLQNRSANRSQISYGASMGRGNESLFAGSGSHDQDGRHKNLKLGVHIGIHLYCLHNDLFSAGFVKTHLMGTRSNKLVN